MTRSGRMNTIIGLTNNEKDNAARKLAESQQLLEQSEKQLADMKRARIDYAAQLNGTSSIPKTASEMLGLRTFIQQLDVAIQQLELQFSERTMASEHQKNQWMKLHNKTNALTGIKNRYQQEEQQTIEHREQFEADELSQRKGNKE